MKQRGIISYGISPNRQNPFAGAAHDAVFNTFRRFSSQFLYWAPATVAGYYIMNWAVERYVASPPPPTAPRDFDHEVAKEGPSLSSFSNRGFCWLGTSTSTPRLVVLSSAARRRSKRWTLRYLGVEPGCSSRERELVLNRLTCISPSLSLHGSNRSRHRQDMDLLLNIGMCWLWNYTRRLEPPTSPLFRSTLAESHVIINLSRSHSFHAPSGRSSGYLAYLELLALGSNRRAFCRPVGQSLQ